MSRGLFAGRFQPFHLGHQAALAEALQQVDEVILGVCATERNLTATDPFTSGERFEMILRALPSEVRGRTLIVPIPDQANNELWTHYVRSHVPSFTVAFTNNVVQRLTMELAGVDVAAITYSDRERLSGRAIRGLLAEGLSEWRQRVPTGTAEVLDKLNATERLAALRGV